MRTGRRAEQRRARRRRQRRIISAVLAVAVLALAVVTIVLSRRDSTPHATIAKQARTQSTVLFQVQGDNGSALSSALLAHDPASRTGAAVLIPPQVIVTVPGTGQLQLGKALGTVPPERSRSAVGDVMGVTVDAGWVVNTPTFSALVNQVGGITAEVDVPVVVNRLVVLNPGKQRLDGATGLRQIRGLRLMIQQYGFVPADAQALDQAPGLPIGAIVDAAMEGQYADPEPPPA